MDDNQVGVTTPEAPAGAVTTSEPTLDELLAEFDNKANTIISQPTPQAAAPTTPDALDPRIARLERRDIERDVNALVDRISRHDSLNGLSSRLIKNYINGEAANDPRLAIAFANRDTDPKTWAKVEKGLIKALANELPKPADPVAAKVTADRAAMAEATKTASLQTPKPDKPNVAKMTSAEFRAYERSMGITV